jgi:hypothetical protein
MSLPVLPDPVSGNLMIPDETGELVPINNRELAADHLVMQAFERVQEMIDDAFAAKRALAAEMRARHGVGVRRTGGYAFKVSESTSWPKGATGDALRTLVLKGSISQADMDRAMPSKPTPDATQLKALLGRLLVKDAEAYKVLVDACSTSAPSLGEVRAVAVDGSTA